MHHDTFDELVADVQAARREFHDAMDCKMRQMVDVRKTYEDDQDRISDALTIQAWEEVLWGAFGNVEFLQDTDAESYLVDLPAGDDDSIPLSALQHVAREATEWTATLLNRGPSTVTSSRPPERGL